MIHKYWNVRLHSTGKPVIERLQDADGDATDEVRESVRQQEEEIEAKVNWIWKTLSAFEEKSATCISDMLLHVSNGAYVDGVMAAKKFIVHVELLFAAADALDAQFERYPLLGHGEPDLAGIGREGEVVEEAHGPGLCHRRTENDRWRGRRFSRARRFHSAATVWKLSMGTGR